jgi:DNA-binding ferritin-like protein (Dps family)
MLQAEIMERYVKDIKKLEVRMDKLKEEYNENNISLETYLHCSNNATKDIENLMEEIQEAFERRCLE